MTRDQRNRSYFALGFLWALLICIVLAIIGFFWLLWAMGILQPESN